MSVDLWQYEAEQDRLYELEQIRQEVAYRFRCFLEDLEGLEIPLRALRHVRNEYKRIVSKQLVSR